MKSFYSTSLQNQKEKNLYRCLTSSDSTSSTTIRRGKKNFISFCCNDYLGLSQNAQVKKAAIAAIEKFGVGARASRYVSGNNSLYEKVEKQIAKMKNCEDAIVFTSGYATAIGAIPALVCEGDLIVADRLIHSSAIDGSKLSGARLMRFGHNDIVHAKKILEENRKQFKKCLIVTETVFSMDGDVGEISELLKLAKKFDAILLSDAAHDLWLNHSHAQRIWTGFQGEVASMTSSANHLQMGTFSKAVGALGGYIAGDKMLIDYLRNFAKSAIYSTALPPAILAAALTSLKIISKKNLGEKALKNAQYFCQLMGRKKPQSAIVVLIVGENKKVLEIAKKVAEKGMLISAIRPPTVEVGKARLRITFSCEHKKNQVKKLAEILNFELKKIS